MPDYLAPFLQQLSEGTRVIQGLKQQALQQEQMKFEREMRLKDLALREQNVNFERAKYLNENGNPVAEDGTVARPATMRSPATDPISFLQSLRAGSTPGTVTTPKPFAIDVRPGATLTDRFLAEAQNAPVLTPGTGAPTSGALPMGGPQPTAYRDKVDPSRIQSYRTPDGKSRDFELLTPEDVHRRRVNMLLDQRQAENDLELQQYKAKSAVDTDAAVNLERALGPVKTENKLNDINATGPAETTVMVNRQTALLPGKKEEAAATAEASTAGTLKAKDTNRKKNATYTASPEIVKDYFNGKDPGKLTLQEWLEANKGWNDLKQRRSHDALQLRIAMVRGGTPAGGVPTGNTVGDSFLEELRKKDPGYAGMIQGIVEGRIQPPGRGTKEANRIMESVMRADPTWSFERAQVRKAFATGPEAKNIGALNTTIVHLSRLDDAAEQLGNGSFTPANEFFNAVKDRFGSKAQPTFNFVKAAAAGEMATALKGNATDQEIARIDESIRRSNSPEQMKAVVREGMQILADKLNTYQERYEAASGGDTSWSPIRGAAKTILQNRGINSRVANPGQGGGSANDPLGIR